MSVAEDILADVRANEYENETTDKSIAKRLNRPLGSITTTIGLLIKCGNLSDDEERPRSVFLWDDDLTEYFKLKRDINSKQRANMTPEQKEAYLESQRKYDRQRRANMTPEQKEAYRGNRRKYDRQRRANMTPEQKKELLAIKKESRDRTNKEWADKHKSKCARCGYDKTTKAIHLHHFDESSKHPNLREVNGKVPKWKSVSGMPIKYRDEEVKKCVPLCGNCHTEVHEYMYSIKKVNGKFVFIENDVNRRSVMSVYKTVVKTLKNRKTSMTARQITDKHGLVFKTVQNVLGVAQQNGDVTIDAEWDRLDEATGRFNTAYTA